MAKRVRELGEVDRDICSFDYDPEHYPRMGMLLKKKRESDQDAGFFELIGFLYQFDFLGVDGALIDRMFWSRVALRSPSPIVVNVHDEEEGCKLTYEERVELARMIWMYYNVKWNKQKAVVSIEYDPIHNYLDEWEDTSSGQDSRSGSGTLSRVDGTSGTRNVSSTRTDNLGEKVDYDVTDERTDDISKTTTYNTQDQKTFDTQETEDYDHLNKRTDYNTSDQRTDNLNEKVDYGSTTTRTDNLTETKTYGKTSTRTDNLTKTDSGDNGTKEEQIYAFNSIAYQPSNKEIHTGYGSNTQHNTGTQGTVDGGTDGKTNTGTQAEARTGDDTKSNTGTQTNAKTGYQTEDTDGTITKDKDGTETANKTGTETVADTGTQTNKKTGSETVANTGTQTVQEARTDSVNGTRSDMTSSTETGTSSRDRSGVHSGNIGNLTSQKMITEEIALWKWNFIEEVLRDATEFLTLQVYC